jgi:hypothetical protein
MPELFDNNSFEQWQADGAKDAAARGLEAARKALDGYAAPALDAGVDEALGEFVARRERELPDRRVEPVARVSSGPPAEVAYHKGRRRVPSHAARAWRRSAATAGLAAATSCCSPTSRARS